MVIKVKNTGLFGKLYEYGDVHVMTRFCLGEFPARTLASLQGFSLCFDKSEFSINHTCNYLSVLRITMPPYFLRSP